MENFIDLIHEVGLSIAILMAGVWYLMQVNKQTDKKNEELVKNFFDAQLSFRLEMQKMQDDHTKDIRIIAEKAIIASEENKAAIEKLVEVIERKLK